MIIHILKLIRSRMGGSGWILAELLVVFVVIWFMTSYFLMMGKSCLLYTSDAADE